MKNTVLSLLLLTAAFALQPPLAAQARTVAGTVLNSGQPFAGANVFVLGTLDGALTDSIGRFAFETRAADGSVLVVQCLLCRELRVPFDARTRWELSVESVVSLPGVTATAGRYQTGDAPDAELDALAVVQTPGAAADVYRALQTFPGVQPIDEGAGLFVRGGDVSETRVFVNDALVLAPYKYESPTGGFFGAFDPFLLDGIQFSSGGFGAEHGDALSAVADLRTLRRPTSASFGATASLASLSATAALPLSDHAGVRATWTRSHTELMFRLNGTETEFTQVPEGRDASVLAEWAYGSGSSLRLLALDQWSSLGVLLHEPSFEDALDASATHRSGVLDWKHVAGSTSVAAALTGAGAHNRASFGVWEIDDRQQMRQLRARIDYASSAWLVLSGGVEAERRVAEFQGRTPERSFDQAPGAPTDTVHASIGGTRRAAFAQLAWSGLELARLTVGVRTDASGLTGQRTWDPRVSLAAQVSDGLSLTAAWGHYHQVPEPDLFEPSSGEAPLRSMRAAHRVLGAQWERGSALARVEVYDKSYRDLAALRRDRTVNPDGSGSSRGVDVFARSPRWRGLGGHAAYSYLRARRTDPDTREVVRSPFDITHVFTAVASYDFASAYTLGLALRRSTGRPLTPVLRALPGRQPGIWEPVYGAPFSERLPDFSRLDASASRLIALPGGRLLVLFVAVDNILDRRNIDAYRYSSDYSERTPVRSAFNRSVYFGVTGTF